MKPRRVYTAGTFDLPHAGHVSFLRKCSFLGDVTVGLNTDKFVARYKGQPPIIDYDGRRRVLLEFRSVAQVLPQDSDCLGPQLERVRPDYLVVGSDWARKDYYRQIGVDQDWLDDHAITLVYVPYTVGVSSSGIRSRLVHGGSHVAR